MQYSDDWPSALEPMVIAFGATAALGWVFARNLVQARIVMCLLVASMVAGPLMSDIFTISSTQAGTNPVSGPLSNNPAAISRHLEDIRKGHPLWAQQIAYGTPAPPQLTNMLSETKETWAAATYTAQNAALYQLSSNRPVMAIGGWLGKDPAPDLRRFKELVADGRIRYFIPQRALLDRGTVGPNSIEITEWVQATYPAQTVEGVEFFDLRTPRGRIQ
jgi:hypothetical protein